MGKSPETNGKKGRKIVKWRILELHLQYVMQCNDKNRAQIVF